MPLIHGVHMRWAERKDPCDVCGKVDPKRFMIEVEGKEILCPDCLEDFRENNRDGNSKTCRRSVDNST